jgi:hypothetical protein
VLVACRFRRMGRIYIEEWAVKDRNFSFETASVILSGPAEGSALRLDRAKEYPSKNVSQDVLRDA